MPYAQKSFCASDPKKTSQLLKAAQQCVGLLADPKVGTMTEATFRSLAGGQAATFSSRQVNHGQASEASVATQTARQAEPAIRTVQTGKQPQPPQSPARDPTVPAPTGSKRRSAGGGDPPLRHPQPHAALVDTSQGRTFARLSPPAVGPQCRQTRIGRRRGPGTPTTRRRTAILPLQDHLSRNDMPEGDPAAPERGDADQAYIEREQAVQHASSGADPSYATPRRFLDQEDSGLIAMATSASPKPSAGNSGRRSRKRNASATRPDLRVNPNVAPAWWEDVRRNPSRVPAKLHDSP